jgi:DNA polymerase I
LLVDGRYILLEWDKKKDGEPPVPLLKDKYASERRKAKTLNFSIAYGKTAIGVSNSEQRARRKREGERKGEGEQRETERRKREGIKEEVGVRGESRILNRLHSLHEIGKHQ